MTKNGCWERKKAAREFGTGYTDYSRTGKTGADSKAPIERVAGTAEEEIIPWICWEINFC